MALLKQKLLNLEDLFLMKLQALYDIESELAKALPKMAKKATDPDLEKGLTEHLAETEAQKERLEEIFELLDAKPKKMTSAAIRGLVADAEMIIALKPESEILDPAIIASARSVEHFEISKYLSAISWAEALGHDRAVELLQTTLEEERASDAKLEALVESTNERAIQNS